MTMDGYSHSERPSNSFKKFQLTGSDQTRSRHYLSIAHLALFVVALGLLLAVITVTAVVGLFAVVAP